MAAAEPALSVLIPAHNGSPWIRRAVDATTAAAQDLPVETLVVDNASLDETPSLVADLPGIRLLKNAANLGFSQAVNRAASEAKGRALVVVNQDLYLAPGSLRAIAGFLSDRDAVVGGRLSSENGSEQPSCGPFPTLAGTLARLALPRTRRKYYLRPPTPAPSGAARVNWVTGAFLACTRKVFDAVGGFDTGYFMYYEDVDFCFRARQAGFPTYYLPAAQAVHAAPYAERGAAPDWLRREVRRSQTRYFDKHRPPWESAAIKALNRAYFAAHGWDWNAPETARS